MGLRLQMATAQGEAAGQAVGSAARALGCYVILRLRRMRIAGMDTGMGTDAGEGKLAVQGWIAATRTVLGEAYPV